MLGHFVTPTIANGRVYVGTERSLAAYGLFQVLNITGGVGQSATVGTPLTYPIQVQANDPYSGQPDVGVTVNFSDGCTKSGSISCGTLDPLSAVTDANGNASAICTVPEKAGTHADNFRHEFECDFRECHHHRHGYRWRDSGWSGREFRPAVQRHPRHNPGPFFGAARGDNAAAFRFD